MRPIWFLAILCPLVSGTARAADAIPPAPVAKVQPVTDTYFGTKVVDPYRWMEKDGPQLAAWMKGQNAHARAVLATIPERDALQKEVEAADAKGTDVFGVFHAGSSWFFLQLKPGESLATLDVRLASGKTRVLVDPNTMAKKGTHFAISWYTPSFDGKYVAYAVAAGGSERATLHVMKVKTGKQLAEAITRTDGDFGFVPVAWRPDGKSFYYYRLRKLGPKDPPSGKFLQSRAYLHVLGEHPDGDGDQAVFGYGVDPQVPFTPDQDALIVTRPGSDYAFGVQTRNETFDVITGLWVAKISELGTSPHPWKRVSGEDGGLEDFDVHGDSLYLLTHKDAPRLKVLVTSLSKPDLAHAKVVVPESDKVVKALVAVNDGLYLHCLVAGLGEIDRVPYDGGKAEVVHLPFSGSVYGLTGAGGAGGVAFVLTSWTESPRWYTAIGGKVADTGLEPRYPLDYSEFESSEVMATSYDGTRVPLSIVMKKGTKLDGSHPTLLIGYGSYGFDMDPAFLPAYRPWLARGGILAVAHVRGGGELGEGWHQAGMKLRKLNTVFDYIACAQYLVDKGYTSPSHLGGRGTSAGGVTIGGAITWRPDLFGAAIDAVGMTDTLRVETTPNGPPNIVEFGSTKTVDGFHGLYAMSAYAHVRDGVAYPAVLCLTGANDPRVAPWIVAKMAARLQAATSSGKPVLLRVDYDAGHGIGSTRVQRDSQLADEFAFLLWQLGGKG